ncbi:MAG: serine/threonine-protein kinase [Kofleriaceae bacterium]
MELPTARAVFPSGIVGGNYVVGDLLGAGGMGMVFLGRALRPVRTVAIKVLKPELAADPTMSNRFRNEFRACRRLLHPNIPRMIEAGCEHGTEYFVMQHALGVPLGKLVGEEGPLPAVRAVEIAIQILDALAHAHGRGVVHADVKTDNVLIDATDGADRLTLIDFGLARVSGDELDHERHVLSGTPDYMAPEVIRGGVPTAAADIYAVGIILYELLTGAPPFTGGEPSAILHRHLDELAIPPSLRCPERTIPMELERAVMRALEKPAERRFASAAEFVDALEAVRPARNTRPEPSGPSRTAFSTEARTLRWPGNEAPATSGVGRRRKFAAGTRPVDNLARCARASIGEAIISGDHHEIAIRYLELARMLVDDQQLEAAARELEEAIDVVTLGEGPSSRRSPVLWRILLALAAVYDGLGDERAEQIALDGHAHAAAIGSDVGRERAIALRRRLQVTRQNRGAHATVQLAI